MSDYLNRILKKAQEIVPLIVKDYLALSERKPSDLGELSKIHGLILFKAIHSFEAILYLIPTFEIKPFFQIASASALRDIISDLVLGEYLSCKSKDPRVSMQDLLEGLHIAHDLFTAKKSKLNTELFGNMEGFDELSKSFHESLTDYLDEDGKVKSRFRFEGSVFRMLEYIVSQTANPDRRISADLFVWYSKLSKLSHFGGRTLQVIELDFISAREEIRDDFYKNVIETVLLFSQGLLISYAAGEKINSSIELKYKELCKIQSK